MSDTNFLPANSTTLSIRMTEGEKKMITDYAEIHGQKVSDFVRETIMEKIEDLIDYEVYLETIKTLDDEELVDAEDVLNMF